MGSARSLAVLLAGLVLAGQAPPRRIPADEVTASVTRFSPAAHIEAASNEVQVDVRVWDGRHRLVPDLKASDFAVDDNGQPQHLTGFSTVREETAPPLGSAGASASASAPPPPAPCPALSTPRSVVVFFDDISTENNDLAYARNKAKQYLGQSSCDGQLPAGEEIGIATSSGVHSLPFTPDAGALPAFLPRVVPRPLSLRGLRCPLITPYQAWAILHSSSQSDAKRLAVAQGLKCGVCGVRDCETYIHAQAEEIWGDADNEAGQVLALLHNAVDALARRPGRRTLVLASSGFLTQDFDLQRRQQALIDAALRAGVVINALDARGLTAPAPGMGAWNDPYLGDPSLDDWRLAQDAGGFSPRDSAMWEIAESTGGDFFHDNNDLRLAFAQDLAGPAVFYTLSFARPDLKPDGAFHRIKVHVTAPGHYTAAARYGYFAPVPDPDRLTSEQWRAIDRAVMGSDATNQLDVEISSTPAPGGVHVGLRLDPHSLALRKQNGRHRGHVTAVLALFSADGNFITGQQLELAIRFRDATLQQVSRPGVGLPLGLDLKAAPGKYRLRVVILDSRANTITARTGHLDIAPIPGPTPGNGTPR